MIPLKYIPAIIGLLTGMLIGASLYFAVGWWGFLLLFPWIGGAVYVLLCLSLCIPLIAFYGLHYDVRAQYIGRDELAWMIVGSVVYYLFAIPLAFAFSDQRAFCKILCPVSLVMKVPTRFAKNKKRPTGNQCIECGVCNNNCPMDVDIQSYISSKKKVTDTECISCGSCSLLCPENALR